MISSALLNLIVSIVAVGLFVAVLRVVHLAAGGRFERTPAKPQGTRGTNSSVLRSSNRALQGW
jgi:hypothetical protein